MRARSTRRTHAGGGTRGSEQPLGDRRDPVGTALLRARPEPVPFAGPVPAVGGELRARVLDEAVYELGNRPDWISIPIRADRRLLEPHA